MTPELTQNLQAISSRFPEVFEELKGQALSLPTETRVKQFLARIYGEQEHHELFQRWVRLAPKDSCQVLVTCGFGDGSHIHELLDALPGSSRVCVLEADVAMLLGVLQKTDVAQLLNDPRFILLTPFGYREIINRLNLELIGIQSARAFIYAPIYETSPALYQNLMDTVMRQLTIRWNQLRTDITNAEVVFSNTIENLANHHFGCAVQSLRGLFPNYPFVLVGAGPSLDESMEFLKAAQGKAVIAVVNSAYRAVLKNGIKPDLTVAVDPYEGTYRGYADTDTSHPLLISTFLVYPKVPKLFEDRVVPLSSFNFLMTTMRRLLKLPEEEAIVGDGTVSSTVVNLAAYMGCNEIYLVGQDMAVKPTGQIHTKDSFYTDDQHNTIDTSKCRWIPGNHGELVPVEEKLHAYLRIFENQVSHYAHIRFYNLARTGSKIHGVPYINQEEAIQKLVTLPSYPFHQTLIHQTQSARLPENAFKAVTHLLKKYHQFLESLLQALMPFAIKVESSNDLKALKIDDPLAVEEAHTLGLLENILELIRKNPLFATLLSEGRTKKEYHDFICAEEPWKLITDNHARFEELLPQTWALVEGAIFQMECLEEHLLNQDPEPEDSDVPHNQS